MLTMDWEKKEKHWSFPVIYMHTQNTINSPPEVDNGLEGKGERHWSLPIMYMHTQNTTHHLMLTMDWEKKEKHWSFPVIYMHTQNTINSPPEVDNGLEGKGEALVTSSHTCTHKTQLTL